jgi:hypothetical protein
MLILVVAVQEVLQVVGPDFLNLPGGDVFRQVPKDFNIITVNAIWPPNPV